MNAREKYGEWDAEEDRNDKILLSEGQDCPDGYLPLYRDKATYLLVVKAFRPVTKQEEINARGQQASSKEITRLRRLVKDSQIH